MASNISIFDRVASRAYYARDMVEPQDIAGLGLAFITTFFSPLAGLTLGLGYLGYRWATSRSITKVESRPYFAKQIPLFSMIRDIGSEVAKSKVSQRGVILNEGRENDYVCDEAVHYSTGADISLFRGTEKLKKQGYQVVESPKAGDIIFYFHSDIRDDEFTHVGTILEVDHGIVWVQSKWGRTPFYTHLEDAVPRCYDDAVVYFRKEK